MRRAIYKKNPSKIIGIMAATVLATGALFCTGVFTPFGKDQASEIKAMEKTENTSAPEKKERTVKLEIVEPDNPTLNQETKRSNISASRQSSLEKAIDDLIELTESDG